MRVLPLRSDTVYLGVMEPESWIGWRCRLTTNIRVGGIHKVSIGTDGSYTCDDYSGSCCLIASPQTVTWGYACAVRELAPREPKLDRGVYSHGGHAPNWEHQPDEVPASASGIDVCVCETDANSCLPANIVPASMRRRASFGSQVLAGAR